jgi:hypothetical protein
MFTTNPFFSFCRGPSFPGFTGKLEQGSRLAHHLLSIGSGGGSPAGQKTQKVSGDPHPARLRGIAGGGLLGQFSFQASTGPAFLQRRPKQTRKEIILVTKGTTSLRICTWTEGGRLSEEWCFSTHHQKPGALPSPQLKSCCKTR